MVDFRWVGAGMVPGYAVGLRYFFSGVPLGYGDLAKRFKFAVPLRGAWRDSKSELRVDRYHSVPGKFTFPPLPVTAARPPIDPARLPARTLFPVIFPVVFSTPFFIDF